MARQSRIVNNKVKNVNWEGAQQRGEWYLGIDSAASIFVSDRPLIKLLPRTNLEPTVERLLLELTAPGWWHQWPGRAGYSSRTPPQGVSRRSCAVLARRISPGNVTDRPFFMAVDPLRLQASLVRRLSGAESQRETLLSATKEFVKRGNEPSQGPWRSICFCAILFA